MKQEIQKLIEISNFYGRNKEFVIAGGGNTSFKNKEHIWIKASGHSLATIGEEGFAILDRKKLHTVSTKEYNNDITIRENHVKEDIAAACISTGKRPSVETSLHEVIEYAYVVHTHPTLVNGLLCSKNVRKTVDELFGDDVLFVPYTDPGYVLFKEVEKRILIYREQKKEDPKVILLENHGIFVSADTTEEIKTIYDEIFQKISSKISKLLPTEKIPIKDSDFIEVLPLLRGLLHADKNQVLRFRNNELIARYTAGAEEFTKIIRPFTPDEIVYCKSEYLFLSYDHASTSDIFREAAERKIHGFKEKTGILPKVILIQHVGMVTVADDVTAAETIADVFEDAMKVSFLSENFGGPKFMTPQQISFIDNWEVENYRRKVAGGSKSSGNSAGKVVIITGGAQGFGEGIVRDFYQKGANVVIADLNVEKSEALANELNASSSGKNIALSVKTDVSNFDSLTKLMHATVLAFGGIDVFISNAGILRAGGVDEMTPESFELMTKINYTGYFFGVKAVAPIMKLQHSADKSAFFDIIQINSKSGLKGSNKNFTYAGGKFGGIGLTQSFALELMTFNIKVNSICPGNFFEGPLWSDPKKGLFVQYLQTGKVPGAKTIDDVKRYYESQVPAGRGCRVEDVMRAIYYAIDQQYETGQAIPVTGGQIMLS
jgi:rhamnose utilization protein RhaD (predicted bifunctional aldolase and dehydrogenase)/NAD(P)-dependent dehydrogenase (short-subunit alcohol dehydrogenase family)